MKYDSLRNIPRNKKLVAYVKRHKEKRGLSWKEIGEHFSIDGSRAFRIYQKYGKKGVRP